MGSGVWGGGEPAPFVQGCAAGCQEWAAGALSRRLALGQQPPQAGGSRTSHKQAAAGQAASKQQRRQQQLQGTGGVGRVGPRACPALLQVAFFFLSFLAGPLPAPPAAAGNSGGITSGSQVCCWGVGAPHPRLPNLTALGLVCARYNGSNALAPPASAPAPALYRRCQLGPAAPLLAAACGCLPLCLSTLGRPLAPWEHH